MNSFQDVKEEKKAQNSKRKERVFQRFVYQRAADDVIPNASSTTE